MKKILAGIILVLALALPANAAGSSNVTLLYGWNGTNFVPLLTDGNGTLMTTMNTTDSVGLNPNLNNTYDLGTTALLWANLYARSVRGGSGPLSLFAGESERVTLLANGNVGVRSASPSSALEINGTLRNNESAYFAVTAGNSGFGTASPAAKLEVSGTNIINNISLNVNNTLYVNASGNVGIGTTGPGAKLDVYGTIRTTIVDSSYYADMTYLGTTYNLGASEVADNIDFKIAGGGASTTGGNMRIWTQAGGASPAERMRITKDGNVGIGTTAPNVRLGEKLDIATSANYGGAMLSTWSTTAAHGSVLDLARSKSATMGTHSALASGDTVGFLSFRGSDGSTFQDVAFIQGDVDGTVATSQVPGRMMFWTTSAAGTATERMRIDKSGNVGIGTTGPATLLDVRGSNSTGYISTFYNSYNGAGGKAVRIVNRENSANGVVLSLESGDIATADALVTVLGSGNVGIGTTGPNYKLDVKGDINASSYRSNGTDYAEWMRVGENESISAISAGDIVAVVGGKITKPENLCNSGISSNEIPAQGQPEVAGVDGSYRKTMPSLSKISAGTGLNAGQCQQGNGNLGTGTAALYMVVTDSAGVVGNEGCEAGKCMTVAFIGQVRTKVSGHVSEGDYILVNESSIGYAKPKDRVSFDEFKSRVVGIALESKNNEGISRISVAVGV